MKSKIIKRLAIPVSSFCGMLFYFSPWIFRLTPSYEIAGIKYPMSLTYNSLAPLSLIGILWLICSLILVAVYIILFIIDFFRAKSFNKYRFYALCSCLIVWAAVMIGAHFGIEYLIEP